MKFGFFFELVTNKEVPTYNDHGMLEVTNWGGNSTGNGYADLLMGRVASIQQSTPNFITDGARQEYTFFAQDSWKASRRLTIEIGARFQHPGWVYERNGYMFGFDSKLYDPDSPIEAYTGLVSPHLGWDGPKSIFKNPALVVSPRLGFAYDLTGRGNTVIRGGAGVFRYVGETDVSIAATSNPPLMFDTYLCCGLELRDIEAIDPTQDPQKATLSVMEPLADKVPTTLSLSFTLSHRLPAATVLEASYVGNNSRHQRITSGSNINAVPEGAMFGFPLGDDDNSYRPFLNYGSINMIRHSLSQNYNSLQVTANRQTGRINYSMAYTFSKALGIGGATYGTPSDNFDQRRRSYSVLPYDRTHGFSVAYNILLPGTFRQPVVKGLFQGWQVSGISQWQSGAPLAIPSDTGGGLEFSGTMADGQQLEARLVNGTPDTPARPWLICDPRDGLAKGQYANPACFVAPLPGKNGTYAMPYMKGPGFQNHDISVFKNWEWTEHRKVQFRFSMYNFPNHPIPFFAGGDPGLAINFENGVPDQDSLTKFGKPSLKKGRRLMQFAIKFYF